MAGIVLSDDELRSLERQFGPAVRKMGPWNSDGTFGYSWISMEVVEKAAESINDPAAGIALSRLNSAADANAAFTALLEAFGRPLVEAIVAVYKQRDLELKSLAKMPSKQTPKLHFAAAG